MATTNDGFVWRERKRNVLGLPWTFTTYAFSDKKLLITSGFLSKHEEEVRLYRIMDVTVNCSLLDRLLGIGSIHICSTDKSTPDFDIVRVPNPSQVKDQLSDLIEAERTARRVGMRELMDDDFEE